MEWIELKIRMLKKGITFNTVAKEFGVTRQYIRQVVRNPKPPSFKGKRAKIIMRLEELLK